MKTITKEELQLIWGITNVKDKRRQFKALLDCCNDYPSILEMRKKLPNASASKIDLWAKDLFLLQEGLRVIK